MTLKSYKKLSLHTTVTYKHIVARHTKFKGLIQKFSEAVSSASSYGRLKQVKKSIFELVGSCEV